MSGTTSITLPNVDPCAGEEEQDRDTPPVYEREGWMMWSIRSLYNAMYFVAINMNYVTHSAVGNTEPVRNAQSGYWTAPQVRNK